MSCWRNCRCHEAQACLPRELNEYFPAMKTTAPITTGVLNDATLSHAAVEPVQRPRYPVDPSSPEFTHLLMKCFTEARNEAIEENRKIFAAHDSARKS